MKCCPTFNVALAMNAVTQTMTEPDVFTISNDCGWGRELNYCPWCGCPVNLDFEPGPAWPIDPKNIGDTFDFSREDILRALRARRARPGGLEIDPDWHEKTQAKIAEVFGGYTTDGELQELSVLLDTHKLATRTHPGERLMWCCLGLTLLFVLLFALIRTLGMNS